MSAFSDAVVGIATGIGSLVTTAVLIKKTWFDGKGRKAVARQASTETALAIFEALADGQISADELDDIQRDLREGEDT